VRRDDLPAQVRVQPRANQARRNFHSTLVATTNELSQCVQKLGLSRVLVTAALLVTHVLVLVLTKNYALLSRPSHEQNCEDEQQMPKTDHRVRQAMTTDVRFASQDSALIADDAVVLMKNASTTQGSADRL